MRISFDHAGIDDIACAADMRTLAPYVAVLQDAVSDHTYAIPEAALACGNDERVLQEVHALRERLGEKLKTVLLVGIGGSDLGARAVYETIQGHIVQYGGRSVPRLYSFGTVEPGVLRHVQALIEGHLDPEELALVVVSKSGGTTETLTNARVLFDAMEHVFGKEAAARQTVVISDAGTALSEAVSGQGMTHIAMPHSVGGRYSVATAVGLVPLALLGIDVRAYAEGFAAGAQASVPENGVSSAAVLASVLARGYMRGLTIHELFVWHPELETLGKWYRQLLAESIGKHTSSGESVGITPAVAVGSVDLHSHGQLVFGGPQVRMTTFVAAPSTWETSNVLRQGDTFPLSVLDGKTDGDVLRAIYDGVRSAYRSHDLPYVDLELATLDARELGAFMAVHMASVMYLAQLLHVNAFDQPDVEAYKEETRRILAASA